jgi:hypothetical protein
MIERVCSFLVVSSGKPSCRPGEAHLPAEHRQGAGAGAVGLAFVAVFEHVAHEVEVLLAA